MKLNPLFYGPQRVTRSMGRAATVAFSAGGVMLVWSAYIHFHLWQSEGYRHIPTIGVLFLFQSIAGVVIGLALVAVRRVWVGVLGIGFAVSTMAGFLLSVGVGLFGFQDTWSAPYAETAFSVEAAALVMLLVACTLCFLRPARTGDRPSRRDESTGSTVTAVSGSDANGRIVELHD